MLNRDKTVVVAYLIHLIYICLGRSKKATNNLGVDNQSVRRDSKPRFPKYELEVWYTAISDAQKTTTRARKPRLFVGLS
jgi:hypothetical protein